MNTQDNKKVDETKNVETVVNAWKEAEKILLEKEVQTTINFLNKSLKPNYLKITDYKEFDNIWTYKDEWVKFFKVYIDYDIKNETLADFDITINKWSISVSDYNKKNQIYKDNLKRVMLNTYYKAYGYDKLQKTGIIWYISNEWNNNYKLNLLWDYVENKFKDKTNNISTLWKIQILKDYFNNQEIFFDKKDDEILWILDDVKKELSDKDFDTLYPNLKKLFFQ